MSSTITDRDFTIVTVAAPTIHVEPVDEEDIAGEVMEGAEIAEAAAESPTEEDSEE